MTLISKVDKQDSSHQQMHMKDKKNEKGQSTTEFIVTFAFAMGILFIFVKIALNVTNGYLVHYATFAASRAYLVFDNNSDTPSSTDNLAKNLGKDVFKEIITDSSVNLSFNGPEDNVNKVFVGAKSEFDQGFAFGNFVGGSQSLNFVSESFLGRAPPVSECAYRVCDSLVLTSGGGCALNTTAFDNGC